MKRGGAVKKKASNVVKVVFPEAKPESRSNRVSYASKLRALGQALEAHKLLSLDLELASGNYVIRGKAKATKAAKSSFTKMVRKLICGAGSKSKNEKDLREIALSYSPSDLEQMDSEAKAKRAGSTKLPDPFSISQLLRSAGHYLDKRKEMTLVGITIKDQKVTIRYKTAEGRFKQAKQDLEYFYDYWVKKYLRRSNRPKPPPPSDPSLIVTWEGIKRRSA